MFLFHIRRHHLFFLHTLIIAFTAMALPAAAANCPPQPQQPTAEALQRWKSEARDHGFLWKIEKNQNTSWLYGTLHVGKENWLMPGPQVTAALRSSQTVALEMDPMDPAVQQKMSLLTQQGAGQIPPDLQGRIKKLMDNVCLPDAVMNKMHPAFLFAALELLSVRRSGLEAGYGVEYVLSGAAHAGGKSIVALETPEQQVRALIGDDSTVTKAELIEVIEQLESGKPEQQTERIAQMWADSDIEQLNRFSAWCECLVTATQRAEMKRLLDDRNPAMADAIDALMQKGDSVFAAVGSLHMAGDIGLPALLSKKGYRVTRVMFEHSGQ